MNEMVQNRVVLWMKLKRRTSLSLLNGLSIATLDATVLDLNLCTMFMHMPPILACVVQPSTLHRLTLDPCLMHTPPFTFIGTSITAALLDLCFMLDALS